MNILHLIGDDISFGSCRSKPYTMAYESPHAGVFAYAADMYPGAADGSYVLAHERGGCRFVEMV
jgi:hypothetical protein